MNRRWSTEGERIFLRGVCPRGQQSLGESAVLDASSPDEKEWVVLYTPQVQWYIRLCLEVRTRRRHRYTNTARALLKVCMRPDGGLQVAAEDDEPLDRTSAVPSSIVHHT